jgi:hypothetical protein
LAAPEPIHSFLVDIDKPEQMPNRDFVTNESPEEQTLVSYFEVALKWAGHSHREDLNSSQSKLPH